MLENFFNLKELSKRALDITYRHRLSHIGSVLTSLPAVAACYSIMDLSKDKFILSNGHAGLALYVVLESLGYGDAEDMLRVGGIHPDMSVNDVLKEPMIHASTGSLGQGLPIALGMALADRDRRIFCTISDGECAEGSIWEALRIKGENALDNLKVVVIANGYGAYSTIDTSLLHTRLLAFDPHISVIKMDLGADKNLPPFLRGLSSHYHVMDESDYEQALLYVNGIQEKGNNDKS